MNWESWIDPNFSTRFCMTLLHSLWQMALLAALAWGTEWVFRTRLVRRSYALYTFAFVTGLLLLPVTYLVVDTANLNDAGEDTLQLLTDLPTQVAEPPLIPATSSIEIVDRPLVEDIQQPPETRTVPAMSADRIPSQSTADVKTTDWSAISPWILGLYATGVLIMFVRLGRGIWHSHRLTSSANPIADGPAVDLFKSLTCEMSRWTTPVLATADRLVTPQVIGLIRPVILVPASLITSLTTDELRLILTHELTHIRRHDLWVNLLQRLAETLLFFNPAMWFLSRRISVLREFCCDEATCRATTDSDVTVRTRYASALLRVAELSQRPRNSGSDELLTLATSRSPSELRRRIAHLLGEPIREPLGLSRGSIFALIAAIAIALASPVLWTTQADVVATEVSDSRSAESEVPETTADEPQSVDDDQTTKEYTFPITVIGRALNEQGKPIADAEIFLAAQHPGYRRLAKTKSAQDGTFKFESIPLPIQRPKVNAGRDVGTFELFGIAEGHALAWRPRKSVCPKESHVEEPNWAFPERHDFPTSYGRDDPINLDLTFREPTTIRGRVVDENAQPIPNTKLAIRYCDTQWQQADYGTIQFIGSLRSLNEKAIVPPEVKTRTTDAEGRFEFTGLPADSRWQIDVRPPGHSPKSIWAVTGEGIKTDAEGRRVYSGDFDLVFPTPRTVKFRVVYADTGKPAPKVGVGGIVTEAGFWTTTDDDGLAEASLPDGKYTIGVTPRYQTPYLRSKSEIVVSESSVQEVMTLSLPAAAVLDVTVIDSETGEPLPGADIWLENPGVNGGPSFRRVYGYRSWEVETRISHYESPRSDELGKMRVNFEPGTHRIGVGKESFPKGYAPVDRDGKQIDCKAGEVTSVRFHMKKLALRQNEGQAKDVEENDPGKDAVSTPNTKKPFELVVQGPDGKPVPRATVEVRSDPKPTAEQVQVGEFLKASTYGLFMQTDGQGRLVLELPSQMKRVSFSIYVDEYGPYWAGWSGPEELPSLPTQFTAQLDAGWSVGGVIVNGEGQPIEGAEVRPSVEYKKRPGDLSQFGVGRRVKTDAEGRWRFNHVPASKSDVWVEIDHPEFKPLRMSLPQSQFKVSLEKEPTKTIELTPGLTVTGRVIDSEGKPIAGALLRTKFFNDIRKATTNANGEYRINGCEPGMAKVVVSADDKAVDMQEVRIGSDMKPVNFQMKPGGTVRVRVVDEKGNPIPKARIFFQEWRQSRFGYFEFDHVNQYADENGVWVWDEAPHDEFKADICRPGGMQLSERSLIAREEEYVFTPPKALIVSGRVIDAKTKKPIPKFRVTPGIRLSDSDPQMHWMPRDGFDAVDGKYEVRFTRDLPAQYIRIEADGYKVVVTRPFKPTEGDVKLDFELEPSVDINATILTPDGKPARNAQIAVGVAGSRISIHEGEIRAITTNATLLKSDAAGGFSTPALDEAFQLVILHPSGFAHYKSADGPLPETIQLTAWARGEGTFWVGSQPGSEVKLSLYGVGIDSFGPDVPRISTRHEVTTDQNGRFVLERVFPGQGKFGRNILYMIDEGATEVTSSVRLPVEFKAGETTLLDLGGNGQAVVGRLSAPTDYSGQVLWNFARLTVQADLESPEFPTIPADANSDVEKRKEWFDAWKKTAEGEKWLREYQVYLQRRDESPYITATVSRDGSFRIDDVPAGQYTLRVRFDQHEAGTLNGYEFEVPKLKSGSENMPVNLGDLQLNAK